MKCLGYFMCACFSSWGIIVDGLKKTLPHVIEYETVTPQELKDLSQNPNPAQQKHPHVIAYSLTIAGQNWTLYLEKNRNLLGRHFSVTHHSQQGAEVTSLPDHEAHCYYHGHIVELQESSASVGLCSGIRGFVRMQDQLYLIEPLAPKGQDPKGTGGSNSEEPGLHAVYNYRHLRRKRSSCSRGNTTTFYDYGSLPSGLFQLDGLKNNGLKKVQAGKSRTVEMVLVVDNTEYKKFGSWKTVEKRMLEVANHVDKLYRPVGLRVMLVGLEMWAYRDQIEVSSNPKVTLERFMVWRQKSLLPRNQHDNAQLVTGVDFQGSTIGLAMTNAMCSSNSGAVNQDHNSNPIGVASTIAHEMGHNLGLSHDSEKCICGSAASSKGCIMADSVGTDFPEVFSSCSQQQLSSFLEQMNPSCLLDSPSTDRIQGGPVCGNAFLEPGEECDCGAVEECMNPCCNASTCTLNAGAMCAEGECCHNCQLRATSSVCRPSARDCDLAEYCSGFSASCPADAYTQNGLSCDYGRGLCYNGQCPSMEQHCKRLWGPAAKVASDACYNEKSCKRTLFGQRCTNQRATCGKLFCSGGSEFPVTSKMSIVTLANGEKCNEATVDPKSNQPTDLGLVPTGTKCGDGMVCYDQLCQDMRRVYGTNNCSAQCNNHGVCNHKRQCHCDPGWAPPSCDVELSRVPKGTDIAVVIGVSLAASLLLVLVIAGSLCHRRKRNTTKRCCQTSSGQSNPLFQPGNAPGSPRLWPRRISQPTFVTLSATQICKTLSFTASPPPTGRLVPSRVAQEVVRPSHVVLNHTAVAQPMPLPPSRPLPPLQRKGVPKPKPPVPPAKPSGAPSWKHNQWPVIKTVPKPPVKPT